VTPTFTGGFGDDVRAGIGERREVAETLLGRKL
jgi:hypothetical protein